MLGEKGYNLFDFEETIEKDVEERRKNNTVFKKIGYFVEDNIDVIVGGLIGGGCTILGYVIGCKATANAIGKGMDVCNNIGFIRYFDKNGNEIFGEDVEKRITEIAQNIRHK